MIAIELHGEGVILPVRAQAGSRKSELRGEQEGALKVAVTQLGLRKSQLEMISGETSPQKKFLVRDMSIEQLRAAIDAILAADR